MVNFIDIHSLLLNPISIQYLIEDLIEDQTLGAIIGESGSGKSFAAISLALSVATEVPFAGKNVKRTGAVIYFAGEGKQGVPRRINAWAKYHGVSIPKGRLFMPGERITFDKKGAMMAGNAIAAIQSEHGAPVLLIIDTLARAMPPESDENSTRDMMKFINNVDDLRKKYGCVVVIVHHTGYGEDTKNRPRGSSAFRASIDWEFLTKKAKRKKGKGTFEATKMKDAELPDPMSFEIEPVEESAVIVFGESAPVKVIELKKDGLLGLSTLRDTFARLGRQHATKNEWRDDFYAQDKAIDKDTKRQNFNRGINELVGVEKVVFDGEFYTLA